MISIIKIGTKTPEKINTFLFILNPLNSKIKKNNINPVLDPDSNIIINDKEIINILKYFSLKFEFSARQIQKIETVDNILGFKKTPSYLPRLLKSPMNIEAITRQEIKRKRFFISRVIDS